MKTKQLVVLGSVLAAMGIALVTTTQAQSPVEINYWLWDSNQEPAYKQCAENFSKVNPGIKVNVIQKGWDDYWTGITTGFISGTAPDIFTNHLAKYPEFANNQQIVDIAPFIKEDKVATDIYTGDLFKLWGRAGKQYGLPKDWDTVAIVYNKALLKEAGVSEASLASLTWNPKNGGSFEKIMAKLTVDANGNRGDSPKFDKTKVKTFGWASLPGNSSGGAYGQTEWSHFAVSNGFKFNDGPWSTKYNYDDPKLAESLQWQADISLKKGYAPLFKDTKASAATNLFFAGKVAMIFDGSWMISTYKGNTKAEIGFAQLPIGPAGRKTMFNGLADSIWVGSKKQKEAWQWLKYMGTAACQDVVGNFGVVFPAIPSAVNKALASYKSKGLDVSAFTKEALAKNTTFLFPITDNAGEIGDIMQKALDRIFLGDAQAAEVLKEANTKVNALFK
jgi:multiple sugar transport system substrate-binding protein